MAYRGMLTARRNIDDARRLMDEKAEQLKAVGQLATMMAFFAVSAFCEIRIPQETESIVILIFGLLSAVVVNMIALYACLCNIQLVTKAYSIFLCNFS